MASTPALKLSSFIGRERELSQLQALLADGSRLLTLTGPGGTGKTRLASAVALEVVEDFEDGVWWVELAPLSDPEIVPQAVASVLNVNEGPGRSLTDAIVEDLKELEILLVLDNCEHLIGACAELADVLLRACPRLGILATSREALGIAGERNFPVPPLSVPDPERPPSESLAGYEAVRLFVERAQDAAPGFALTEQDAPAVAKLCRTLDGMPLAIELAAARVRVLSVGQISSRLDDAFALLAGGSRTAEPRQRTLRAAIDWSYDLLPEEERVLFRRLSVFVGGFTLEAAEAVCAGVGIERHEVLDLLSHLIDKSLVLRTEQHGAEDRYRLLETVRQYAAEKLREGGEVDRERELHARYFLDLVEEAEPKLKGAEQGAWLERLGTEHDNLRAAFRWALEGGDAELGLRLAVALERFWWGRGHLGEGRSRLDRGLSSYGTLPAPIRAKALNEAGWMALWQGDLGRAVELLEEGLDLFKVLRDEARIATALTNLGHAVLHLDDKERLRALCEEAESLRLRFEDRWAITQLSVFLGMAALYEGEPDRTVTLMEESMATFQDLGDTQRVALCVTYLWMAALEGGDTGRAATVLRDDLLRLRNLKIMPQIYDDLMGCAVVAAMGKQPARAVRLWGAAEAMGEASGISLSLWEHMPTDFEVYLSDLRSRLDATTFDEIWCEGHAMTPEEAIEYALDTEEAATPPQDTSAPSSLLTAREAEILKLVSEGLTNPQVARRLYLSPRTVGQHLRSIYRKLGVSSRAAAAREASQRELI